MAATHPVRHDELAQFGAVRSGTADDAIDGVVPGCVIEPPTPDDVGRLLAWASSQGLRTVIRGGGTKLAWGRVPAALDLLLVTSRLNRVVAHRHGDLTATVQAGATLREFNQELTKEGQWFPIDTPFDEATIGGIVATNDSGPLRSRYGTPRDLLIGITLAMTDGRLVKSGGHVVKNVAGYDLGKLMSGSFGSLAAIVDVTVKLSPIPAASRTLEVRYEAAKPLAEDVARLSASQLEPAAFDLQVRLGPGREASRLLLVRFATSPESAELQSVAAQALLAGDSRLLSDFAEATVWAEQVNEPWDPGGATLRLSWLPAALPQVLALVDEIHRVSAGSVALHARATTGAGFLRLDADDAGVERAVVLLRSRVATVSNVLVLRASPALKVRVDPWGEPASAAAAARALKQAFDPAGILNAGRGPI